MAAGDETIRSRDNRWFRRFRSAAEEHDAEVVLEGPKAVRDAIEAGWTPIAIASASGDESAPPGVRQLRFSRQLLDTLSGTVQPQGVIALFSRPDASAASILSDRRTAVALDGIQDPGNVGTIVRLAAAFDCAGVLLLPGTADAFAPKAVRASAGAIIGVPAASLSIRGLLEEVERRGVDLFAADAGGTAMSIASGKGVLVLGSEGRGVSEEIAARARKVAIPMTNRVESLNVAAAAAILLAEQYRRRRE